MAPEIRFARAGEASVAYRVLGDAGPPVLRVGGVVSSLSLDDMLIDTATYAHYFSEFSRLICFDRRGQGMSAKTGSAATIEQQIEDMEAVRAHTGFRKVTVFGESYGGVAAILYAATFPQRVERLVVSDTIARDAVDPADPESPRMLSDELLRVAREHPVEFASRSARWIAPEISELQHRSVVSYLLSAAGPDGYAEALARYAGVDLRPWLPMVVAPTLVLHAARDHVAPVAHGRFLAEHIAGATYVERDGSAHLLWIDRLAENSEPIRRFVAGAEQAEREIRI